MEPTKIVRVASGSSRTWAPRRAAGWPFASLFQSPDGGVGWVRLPAPRTTPRVACGSGTKPRRPADVASSVDRFSGRLLSGHLGHTQVGDRQLELADVEHLRACFLSARRPDRLRLFSVALHRFEAVVRHGGHGTAGRAVDQQAGAAESLEILHCR